MSPPCYTFPIDAQHTRPPLSSLPSIEVTRLSLGVRCASVRNSKASRGWKWAVDTYTDVLLDRQVCFACSLFAPLRLFRVAIAMPNMHMGRASTVRLRALVLASRSEYTTCSKISSSMANSSISTSGVSSHPSLQSGACPRPRACTPRNWRRLAHPPVHPPLRLLPPQPSSHPRPHRIRAT